MWAGHGGLVDAQSLQTCSNPGREAIPPARSANALTGSAADLAQDTFEAAARAWAVLRGQATGRQRAWLLSTLAHKNVSDIRRRQALRARAPARGAAQAHRRAGTVLPGRPAQW